MSDIHSLSNRIRSFAPDNLVEEVRELEKHLAEAEAELEQYRTKRLLCWDEANPEHGSYDEQGIAEYFADDSGQSWPYTVITPIRSVSAQ